MASNAPTFNIPTYDTGRPEADSNASLTRSTTNQPRMPEAAHHARTDSSPSRKTSATLTYTETNNKQLTTARTAQDDDGPIKEEDDKHLKPHHSHHGLHVTESARHAVGTVSRKFHLHRENRRGPSEANPRRQSRAVIKIDPNDPNPKLPLYIHLRNAVYGSLIMLTTFPYWDMAFWSGWSYTWGSILFVIDSAWAWQEIAYPDADFKGEGTYAIGWVFFIGALFYQLGATMAYLEAINDGSFAGSAMKRHLEGHEDHQKRLLDDKLHTFFGHMIPHHHHDDEDELTQQASIDPEAGWRTVTKEQSNGPVELSLTTTAGGTAVPRRAAVDMGAVDKEEFHEYLTWRWWPTWHALKTHHIKEMGYVACSIQLFGATLYGICGVEALPGILAKFDVNQELWGYYIPETFASCCFLLASILFIRITQVNWWTPSPRRIDWWIGVWAAIGSVGFVMSGALGLASLYSATWTGYQAELSSTWGSFAYLVSSWLQWYESVNHGPVLAFPNNRVPTVMREAHQREKEAKAEAKRLKKELSQQHSH